MRQPTTQEDRWKWWEQSLEGKSPLIHEDEPHTGFYKARKFAYGKWPKGPYVPARIWWVTGETDPETGELTTDEICRAEIDGKPTNPWRAWPWLAKNPISESEWEFLRAMSPLLAKSIPPRPPQRRA